MKKINWKSVLKMEVDFLHECEDAIINMRELTEREQHFYKAYRAMKDLREYLEKEEQK